MSLNSPNLTQDMENDLRAKVQSAIDCNPELRMVVYGVFSIEDLEQKLESELGGAVGVGVGYIGRERVKSEVGPGTFNAARSNATRMVVYSFAIMLAVPSTEFSDQRHDATKLLTVVSRAILGSPIGGLGGQRTWDFIHEKAEPSASTATMLYYSQLWQVAIPVIGNQA